MFSKFIFFIAVSLFGPEGIVEMFHKHLVQIIKTEGTNKNVQNEL